MSNGKSTPQIPSIEQIASSPFAKWDTEHRFLALGGKSRRYIDIETGKTVSRRQAEKIAGRESFEAKAERHKKENLRESLSRPAPGRKKAGSKKEATKRVRSYNKTKKKQASKPKRNRAHTNKGKTGEVTYKEFDYNDLNGMRKWLLSQIPKAKRFTKAIFYINAKYATDFAAEIERNVLTTTYLTKSNVNIFAGDELAAYIKEIYGAVPLSVTAYVHFFK